MDGTVILTLVIVVAIVVVIIFVVNGKNQSSQYTSTEWSSLSPQERENVTSGVANALMNMGVNSSLPPPQPQVIVVNAAPQPQPQVTSIIEVVNCPRHACPIERCGCHVRDTCPQRGCGSCVPIPSGALKATNEDYHRDQYYANHAGAPFGGTSHSFGGASHYPFVSCNCGCGAPKPCKNFRKLPGMRGPSSDNYFTPYGNNSDFHNVPFISSVSAYSPYPAVESCWEKIGLLTSNLADSNPNSEKNLLNLYRRPIAPAQNLWEYQVQDASNFVIKLNEREIRNGDVITVPGKQGMWTAKLFIKDKWICS